MWIEKKSHYNSRVSLHEAPTKNYGKSYRKRTIYATFQGLTFPIETVAHTLVPFFEVDFRLPVLSASFLRRFRVKEETQG